jgi:hypothetical protein
MKSERAKLVEEGDDDDDGGSDDKNEESESVRHRCSCKKP